MGSCVLVGCAVATACSSFSSSGQTGAQLPPAIPAEEVFVTAMTDICFEAVALGQYPSERITDVLFRPAPSAKQRFKSETSDVLYAAGFASAPILVSLPRNENRCDIIAVRGDRGKLKLAAERAIRDYESQLDKTQADIIMALDESPQKGYVLKFSLYADDAVADLKDK